MANLPTNFTDSTVMFGNHAAAHNATNTDVNTLTSGSPTATFTKAGTVRQTVYNVKDYGATGDGVTNDSTAINNAIIAANADYQGVGVMGDVYLPSGSYKVSSPIAPLDGVHIRGAGKFATKIISPGNAAAFVSLGSTSNYLIDFHLSDMTIDGSPQAGTYHDTLKNIFIQYAYRCSFKRLYCENAYASALGLDWPYECVVEDCDFVNAGRGMPSIYDGGNGLGCLINDATTPYSGTWTIHVTRCTAVGCGDIGFLIEADVSSNAAANGAGATFTDCFATGCVVAGYCDAGCYGTSFKGCTAYKNTGDGFILGHGGDQPGTSFYTGARGIIEGCFSNSNTGHGVRYDLTIRVAVASGYTFIGNAIVGNVQAGIAVLLASLGNANQLTIIGNTIAGNNTGNGYAGIYLSTSGSSTLTALKIADNEVVDNKQIGINIAVSITGGEIDSYIGNTTTSNQTTGLNIATGITIDKVRFAGSYYAVTTPVAIVGTVTNKCLVVPGTIGWTNGVGALTILSKSSAYAVLPTDETILVSGTTTITLPTSVGALGKKYTIKNVDASLTTTIATTSSQTIDGVTTLALPTQYEAVTVQSDNSNWQVVNQVATSIL